MTADKERALILAIEPTELSVSRFNDCLVFYRKGLRLPLKRQLGELAEFQVQGTPFTLRGRSGSPMKSDDRMHLSLLAKDIEKLRESAEAWGGNLSEGPEEREIEERRLRWATFTDPEGNELEVVQRL